MYTFDVSYYVLILKTKKSAPNIHIYILGVVHKKCKNTFSTRCIKGLLHKFSRILWPQCKLGQSWKVLVFIRVICNSNHYDEYMKLHIRYVFANKWSTKSPLSYNNMKFKLILSLRILIMSNLYEIVFKLIFTRRTSPSYLCIWNIVFLNIL